MNVRIAKRVFMNDQTIGMLQIISGAVCWGTLGVMGATLNRNGFTGSEVATLRILFAALLLLTALPLFWPYIRQLKHQNLPMLAVQSIIGMLGMSLCYFAAVSRVGAAMAVALLYTAPIWSLFFSWIILGEKITYRSTILTIVAALGVALSMTGNTGISITGILFGLGSGICYALYGVLGKRAMADNPSMLVMFTSITISALILLFLPNTHHAFGHLLDESAIGWLSAISLALIGTVASSFFFMCGLQKMPATRASVFTVFEPFTAVVLAVVWLEESLSYIQFIGIFLIIGVAVANALPTKITSILKK